MTDTEVKLVIGALLHDIGKVIYRQGDDRRKHSKSGYDFLKEIGTERLDKEILDAVLFHHADMLKTASLPENSLAYIVYMADNIASAADRRKKDAEDTGFEITAPLQSVFNILNGNKEEFYYSPGMLNEEYDINYPQKEKHKFDETFYTKIKDNILHNLKGLEWTQEYINSLLEVLEANLTYVPSSTAKAELADISLFDHLKLTAAIASCIYLWLEEKKFSDYRNRLFKNSNEFYEKDIFLLYSMDVSGIQKFIYTIHSKNALKTLRARSFYLEIMMEHIIDSLLEKLHLSRANLIYSGGGHCYLLLPNTINTLKTVEEYIYSLNHWLMKHFQIALFVAGGYAACSANSLKNMPEGSYAALFHQISRRMSAQKGHRYSSNDILELNSVESDDYERECRICKNVGQVDQDGVCPVCAAIVKFSNNILYDDFFTVSLKKTENALPLPGNYYLTADSAESLKRKMASDQYFVRAYSKNRMYTGKQIATKLWVGDYTSGETFEEYAQASEGIKRIGILRADVDNLGQSFVSGFEDSENQNRYVTLSRTATLSRQLSMFFKWHINRILSEGEYSLDGTGKCARKAVICYSGGDDLFIVGAWNEIVELAIDIRRKFEKYVQGTLTISAGIGIYKDSYPISSIAEEVSRLEDASKHYPGKNAVTLLRDGRRHIVQNKNGESIQIDDATYSWTEFEENVLGEKYQTICNFFEISDERGNNFLYNLLELIRSRDEKINFARYVYLLSRMEPDRKSSLEQKKNYREFSEKMYQWIKNGSDSRQLRTAITIYVYLTRGGDGR